MTLDSFQVLVEHATEVSNLLGREVREIDGFVDGLCLLRQSLAYFLDEDYENYRGECKENRDDNRQ